MRNAWGCFVLESQRAQRGRVWTSAGMHGFEMKGSVGWHGQYMSVLKRIFPVYSTNLLQGYDCSATYLYNARPYISISEVSVELQCSTAHWEADSKYSWAALHPWTHGMPTNPLFGPLMRSFLDGTESPHSKVVDDHHRLPIILTLLRMIWSIGEMEKNPLVEFLGNKPRYAEDKSRLLDILDGFMVSPSDPMAMYASRSLADTVHKAQTIHMSHLISADDLMDWLVPLLRGGCYEDAARARMICWASQDAVRVREMAFHSAQTLSIIRQYQFNLPQESWNIFYAGALLWCFSNLLSPQRKRHEAEPSPIQSQEHREAISACRIDYIGGYYDTETVSIRTWVDNGGAQIVSLHGVANLCCAVGRRQVLEQTAGLLRRMHVWGIAQNFLKVILTLICKEESCGTD
jgi:hypothetical protein